MHRPHLIALSLVFAGLSVPAMAGTLYFGDNGTIYKLAANGSKSVFATGTGTANLGMAFNANGDLYVNSRDTNAIYKVTSAGTVSTFASVSSPYALAVDASGNVFTTTPGSGNIIEYSPTGVASTFAAAPGGYAYSLAFNPLNGHLFEGDTNGSIYEFTATGTRTTFATGLTSAVLGLAFDASGDLFASDWSPEINKFTPSGTRSIFATLSSQTLPTSLAFDYATGNLYMTEVANGISNCCQQVINAFNSSGTQSTFTTGLYLPYAIADFQSMPGSSTPEPGSLTLLAAGGLLGIGTLRRRSKRRL